jgi:hypothetical protein
MHCRHGWHANALALTAAGLIGCTDAVAPIGQTALLAKPGTDSPKCDADNGGLTLPTGFCAVVVARDLGRPAYGRQA